MAKQEKTLKDDLADIIAGNLNKLSKDSGKIAYFLKEEDTPTDFTDFISTGSSLLDLAISNRQHGGIAVGRISELTGLEASGKSLIAAHMIVDVQRRGGIAVLIDTEVAVNTDFFESIGVDMEKLVYVQEETIEGIFAAVENIIETVRKKETDKLVLIVVDSLAGASTLKEMEADYKQDGYATGKAIILGKSMRKITSMLGKQKIALVLTNQLRQKMNAMAFSDKYTTSGGMAVAFAASTRIRLSVKKKLTIKGGEDGDESSAVVGVRLRAQVIKNRLGPPFREAEFDIYFDRGIDDIGSWITYLKDKKIIAQGGAWYTYTSEDNKDFKFQKADFEQLLIDNPELKEELYLKLCDSVIMSYKTSSSEEYVADDGIIEE